MANLAHCNALIDNTLVGRGWLLCGVKGSGYGRLGGSARVAEFTDLRWLTIQTRPRQYPF